MPRTDAQPTANRTLRRLAVLVATIIIAGGAWWLTRTPVKLDADHYAATLALYRVCNQRSLDGLASIEAALDLSDQDVDESDDSRNAIAAIIDDARRKRWERASKNCRTLLDQQVHR